MRELAFSLRTMKAQEVNLQGSLKLEKPSMVINLSSNPATVPHNNASFGLLESRLLFPTTIEVANSDLCIFYPPEETNEMVFKEISKKWQLACTLFPDVKEFKSMRMYRSPKDQINGFDLNLWFLAENSLGRIHRHHPFKELHTQILGIGVMQKYTKEDRGSVTERVYMVPGYTHYPFYDNQGKYPWHSYDSITESVWLAIEKH
jgi:hypothetical protein